MNPIAAIESGKKPIPKPKIKQYLVWMLQFCIDENREKQECRLWKDRIVLDHEDPLIIKDEMKNKWGHDIFENVKNLFDQDLKNKINRP